MAEAVPEEFGAVRRGDLEQPVNESEELVFDDDDSLFGGSLSGDSLFGDPLEGELFEALEKPSSPSQPTQQQGSKLENEDSFVEVDVDGREKKGRSKSPAEDESWDNIDFEDVLN